MNELAVVVDDLEKSLIQIVVMLLRNMDDVRDEFAHPRSFGHLMQPLHNLIECRSRCGVMAPAFLHQ